MGFGDVTLVVEVGDGAREFDDAMVRARREIEFLGARIEEGEDRLGQSYRAIEVVDTHFRIERDLSVPCESRRLVFARAFDSGDDCFELRSVRLFLSRSQGVVSESRYFDPQVDTIDDGSRDLALIAGDLRWVA